MSIDFLACLTLHLLLLLYPLYVAAAVPTLSNHLFDLERMRRAATGTCNVFVCFTVTHQSHIEPPAHTAGVLFRRKSLHAVS